MMETTSAQLFECRLSVANNTNPNAGVKLWWTCPDCSKPSQRAGDEGGLKQQAYVFRVTSCRKTCDDFVRDAHTKLLADHATCQSLPDANDLLDSLRYSYSLLGSTPAPIPESCSQSFTEGLLRHRIKTLEKKVATLKNELNEANSKLKTADHWNKQYQERRDVAITITDGNENEADERDWHARSFSASMHDRRFGLVGWVQFWAEGFRHRVVQLVNGLVSAFGMQNDFRAHLSPPTAVEKIIADNLASGIELLSSSHMTDAQTVELDAILTACASSEQAGHSRRITRRLRTSRNTKTWRAAVKRRTDLNEIEKVTLEVGKPCTWRGRPGILRALDVTAGTCEVEFSAVDPETGDVRTWASTQGAGEWGLVSGSGFS